MSLLFEKYSELRKKAQAVLNETGNRLLCTDYDIRQLIEEFSIYQIELELQNEELRLLRDQLESSRRYLEHLFSYAPVGYVVLNSDGIIIDVNHTAARLFNLEGFGLKGQRLQSFIPYDYLIEYNNCLTRLYEQQTIQSTEIRFRVRTGHAFWAKIDLHLRHLPDTDAPLILCSLTNISKEKESEQRLRELTENLEKIVDDRTMELQQTNARLCEEIEIRKQAEARLQGLLNEKEILLKELHHRVKNNMQVINSLMRLQAKKIKEPHVAAMFRESQNRIKAMSLIHELLYRSDSLVEIRLKDYLSQLAKFLMSIFMVSGSVALTTDIEDISLNIDQAIPCGLIVNELLSNSFKYAFEDKIGAVVSISARQTPNAWVTLIVSDNGQGIPNGINFSDSPTLGLQLVTELAEKQLGGTVTLDGACGAQFTIVFPLKSGQERI